MDPKADQSNLDELYLKLTENLDNLVKVYRGLLEVVRREKEILISADLDDLNENNKAKDMVLTKLRALEAERIEIALKTAEAVGADTERPRLLDIALKFDFTRAERLRAIHTAMELLVRRLSELNKQNEDLVKAALNNITGAMDAIRDNLQPKATYERKGTKASRKGSGQLVSREA